MAALRPAGASRAPMRDEIRAADHEEMRDPPRAPEGERVRRRSGSAVIDPFDIPADMIPDGVSLEWKAIEVLGQENPTEQRSWKDQGWLPACKSMFPGYYGKEGDTGSIIVNGMLLMERPMHLTLEAKAEDLQRARSTVRQSERKLAESPDGTAPRVRPDIRSHVEPMEVPRD